uniref:Maestro heat like repeat family member 1 n=1 Tax=Anser cygnoides TaxID=8845 RepID=A0A8B9IQQ1_ANSCY
MFREGPNFAACLSCSGLATTLMDATTDKDPLVQEQIYNALCYLGESEPEEILHSCDEYLRQHDKLAYPHRVIILKAMETVVKNNIASLDKSTAKVVIFLASNEMTKSKEVIREWQQAASSVLVAVGQRFINKVMEEVLTKFQPGILPHYFIVQTFANLSVSNVFGMVPFLNSILGTMLPMLGMAKQDHMKSVFCYALQHFSESIQEYLANLDKAPDPTVRKDTFSNEIFSAYEVLFNSWLQHREAKLRLAVVEAVGPMSYLMPSEKLEEQLPKLIPGILALYKKHAEAFYISKSLCQILEASVNIGSRSLDVQLDALLGTLHPQICAPADPSVPLTVKNHTEVLRCFTVLACSFPDRVLAFLLPKLESSNERTRVGTLLIMRQIINSAPSQMEIKKPFILSSMKLPLQDSNDKVKRAVVQVISAMAHHGYLEQPGGEAMMEYLVRQCALPSEAVRVLRHADDLTSDSVQSISVNTLFLLSTTVDRMNNVLWPYLLEFVTPIQFTNALTPLCKSLMYLAMKKQEEGENASLIRYDLNGNLPSPYALTTRLLVVSSQPYAGDCRGTAALRLLSVLQYSVHPALEQLWSKRVPSLVEHIEENTEKCLCQKEWEEKLLLFLQETLAAVSDNTWICHFVTEMCRQLNSYNGFPLEKNFLYKCIGTTLGACTSKDLVQKQLQELLETARYHEEAEREGLASCFGICAINHLEETLAKLEDFVRSDVFKKSVGLFSIFKDRSDNEVEKIKSTLILCYGFVAVHAPKELVLSRIEADILKNIFQYFNTKVLGIKVETKDLTLKLCLIRSICMISQAIYNGGKCGDFVFSRKAELVAQMVEFIKAEPLDAMRTPVRQRAMVTCTYLVYPSSGGMDAVLERPPSRCPLPRWDRACVPPGVGAGLCCSEGVLAAPAGGGPALPPASMAAVVSPQTVIPFYNLGVLIALFSPRCSDSLASVRQHAVDCVYCLLYIQLCYEGFARDHTDEMVEGLKALKKGLEEPDFTVLFHACHNIAMVVGKRVPPDQLMSLLLAMFEGLADPDKNCSRAATVMINSLLKERGSVLQEKVPDIMSIIHSKLQEVDEEHVRKAAQQTVYILASQHKSVVVSSLLGSALPFDSHTCAMWRSLAAEPTLTSQILEQLLEKVNRDVPYKESKCFLLGSGSERIATPLPLAATCALYEIMSAPESGAAVLGLYAPLFVTLLLRVSCTVGVQLPKSLQSRERRSSSLSPAPRSLHPCSCAVETLKVMLARGGSEAVTRAVGSAGGWDLMASPERHHDGIAVLAGAMARHAGPRLPLIVKNLVPTLSSVFDSQRITTTAFFAELLNSNVVNDLMLLETVMDNMTGRQKDPCMLVRMLALRGLGNISSGSPEKVRKHGAKLLASMVNGMDDKDDPHNLVALEAMSSLSKLLDHLEERDIQSMLLHIAIRIRPFFDSEQPGLRQSSIVLFGNLTKFSEDDCEAFFEQILNGLVTLLLHLQDPKPEVVKACKFALRMCGPNMGCEGLCDMFLNHLREDRSLHYGEFMNNVCKHLMQSYPEMLNRLILTNLFYFKSNWVDIRAAAPMFIGFLVLHVDEDHCQQVDLDQLISGESVPAACTAGEQGLGLGAGAQPHEFGLRSVGPRRAPGSCSTLG